jgi:DnaK suppressor protein
MKSLGVGRFGQEDSGGVECGQKQGRPLTEDRSCASPICSDCDSENEKQREVLSAKRDAQPRVPVAGSWEGDPIDQANAEADVGLQIRLHQSDGRLLRAIEEALARVRHGTYGVCDACQRPISKARLEAVPWTRHCRECKEREHPAA